MLGEIISTVSNTDAQTYTIDTSDLSQIQFSDFLPYSFDPSNVILTINGTRYYSDPYGNFDLSSISVNAEAYVNSNSKYFAKLVSTAGSWSAVGATITITSTAHGLTDGKNIYVAVTSDSTHLPIGTYTITYIGVNSFSITGITGGTSGTLSYNPPVTISVTTNSTNRKTYSGTLVKTSPLSGNTFLYFDETKIGQYDTNGILIIQNEDYQNVLSSSVNYSTNAVYIEFYNSNVVTAYIGQIINIRAYYNIELFSPVNVTDSTKQIFRVLEHQKNLNTLDNFEKIKNIFYNMDDTLKENIFELFDFQVSDLAYFTDSSYKNKIIENQYFNMTTIYKSRILEQMYAYIFYIYGVNSNLYALDTLDWSGFTRSRNDFFEMNPMTDIGMLTDQGYSTDGASRTPFIDIEYLLDKEYTVTVSDVVDAVPSTHFDVYTTPIWLNGMVVPTSFSITYTMNDGTVYTSSKDNGLGNITGTKISIARLTYGINKVESGNAWTLSGTTITMTTQETYSYTNIITIYVTVSSDIHSIPLGAYSATPTMGTNTLTFTVPAFIGTSASSGTVTIEKIRPACLNIAFTDYIKSYTLNYQYNSLWYIDIDNSIANQINNIKQALSKIFTTLRVDALGMSDVTYTNSNGVVVETTPYWVTRTQQYFNGALNNYWLGLLSHNNLPHQQDTSNFFDTTYFDAEIANITKYKVYFNDGTTSTLKDINDKTVEEMQFHGEVLGATVGSGAVLTPVIEGRSISSITITNGGTGYNSIKPIIQISGDGTGATATPTYTNGVLIGIKMTNFGVDYTTATATLVFPTVYTFTLAHPPIKTLSVKLTYTIGGTVYTSNFDDGLGNITGTDITSATINYTTGVINITFTSVLSSLTDITAQYMKNYRNIDFFISYYDLIGLVSVDRYIQTIALIENVNSNEVVTVTVPQIFLRGLTVYTADSYYFIDSKLNLNLTIRI